VTRLPLTLFLVCLAACIDFGAPKFQNTPINGVLSVTATDPLDGETGVPLNATLVLVFSKSMDRSRLEVSLSPAVSLSLPTWDQQDTRATFSSQAPLAPATTYVVTFTGRDATLNEVVSSVFSFTTTASGALPGAPSAAQSTLVLSGTPVADGADEANGTFVCRDSAGVACAAGVTVALSSSDPLDTILSPSGDTDTTGTYTFRVLSTHAGVRTLTATFTGASISAMLTFVPGGAAKLVFEATPTGSPATLAPLGEVRIGLYDGFDNPTRATGVNVTVSLITSGQLSGANLTQASNEGVVVFNDLTLSRANTAHVLRAVAAGLTSATSEPFEVVAWRKPTSDYRGAEPTVLAWRAGSSVIYTGGVGKVFRSNDQGLSFVSRSNGLPQNDEICALETDPVNPDRVYVGTTGHGLFTSADGGVTWTARAVPASSYVCALVAPAAGVVVAGTNDTIGVHKSVDYGVTFVPGTGVISTLAVMDLASADGVTYYAATSAGIHKSVDSGATWVAANTGLTDLNQKRVTVHPTNANIAYSSASGGTKFRTADGGTSWVAMTGANVIARTSRVRATDLGVFFVSDGIYRANHGSNALTKLPTTELYTGYLANDLAAAADESLMFALTSGLQRSVNSGQNWQLIGPSPEPEQFERVLVHHFGATQSVFLMSETGVWRSDSNGPWYTMNIGLIGNLNTGADLLGDKLWLITEYIVFRWVTGTPDRFQQVGTNAFDVQAISSNRLNTMLASGVSGSTGRVGQSGGGAFTSFAVSPPTPVVGVASFTNTNVVLAWTPTTIYRTTNGGSSGPWTTELSATNIRHVAFANAGVAYAASESNGVYVSLDSGDTWTLRNTGLGGNPVTRVTPHPTDSSIAYAIGSNGVYKTSDTGMTWRRISTGLGGNVIAFAIDPQTPETIYAGVVGAGAIVGGLYRSESGGE
jgi:hypothetical protein